MPRRLRHALGVPVSLVHLFHPACGTGSAAPPAVTRRQRRLTAAAGTLAAAVAAAGCGGTASTPQSTGPGPTHLTVAVLPATDDAPFWLALKNGYFRQQGLTVTPEVVAQSTLAVPDLVHGSVQVIGGGNYVTFFGAQAKGALNVRVIAPAGSCTENDFAVVATPKSGITSKADLAGKTIAVGLTNSISTLTVTEMLKASDVSTASVRYVAVPYTQMIAALKAGRVAAASLVEPFLSQAEATLGAEPILPQCQGPTANLPLSGYFATATWVRAHPGTARAFGRAIDQAQALADDDRAAVEKVLPTYIKISPKVAALVNLNSYPTSLDAVLIQRVADLMNSGGLLKQPFNVAPLLFH